MRNGLPLAYSLYRLLWTVLHLSLVGVGIALFLVWFFQDDHGVDAIGAIGEGLARTQSAVANAIPFPWGG